MLLFILKDSEIGVLSFDRPINELITPMSFNIILIIVKYICVVS